ncbi:MAG: hypothetical protein PHO01_01285 [Desulfotomaculaceae bacterium]|nr:hypothetical protein [Desulfotomaculaceae bacterium]
MSWSTRGEFQNYAFKEALHREEQAVARFDHLAKKIRDDRLKRMFNSFAGTSRERLQQLKVEMAHLNIKSS